MEKICTLLLLIYSPTLLSCEGFLPPNNLSIPVTKNEGLTEKEFHATIDKVEKIYGPVAQEFGAELKIERKWTSATVNAGTFQDEGGKHWHINLYGGLARFQGMTEEGFALVICHEIGHHIGGAPKKTISRRPFWSSSEGQADYWATLKCLRRIYENEANHDWIQSAVVHPIPEESCEKSFSTLEEKAMCKRISLGGEAVARLNSAVRPSAPPARFETPDTSVVFASYDRHNAAQCRMDTYLQGALCELNWNEAVSQEDEVQGTCHPRSGHTIGTRPLCWFKPK